MARTYNQACMLAGALDILGERWTLLLCREFLLGPRRFGDLHAALPGIGANLLTKRLRELEEAGVLEGPNSKRGASYRLTPYGEDLRPAIRSLMHWAVKYFFRDEAPADMKTRLMSNSQNPDSAVLIIEVAANLNPAPAPNYTARLELDGKVYTVYCMNNQVIMKRGGDALTIASIKITTTPLLMALRHEIDRDEVKARCEYEGDEKALDHLFATICREWMRGQYDTDFNISPSPSLVTA